MWKYRHSVKEKSEEQV